MFNRLSVFIFALAMLASIPMTVASADDSLLELEGKGAFWAEGKGVVHLKGKGALELTGKGLDMLLIKHASTTKIKIKGQGMVIPMPEEDAILVVGLKGKVNLKGKDLKFDSLGGKIAIRAGGIGTVWLKGKGKFKIKDHPVHLWPKDEIKKFHY